MSFVGFLLKALNDDTSTLTSISKVDLFMFFPCQVLFVFSSFGNWSLMSVLCFGIWFL